MNCKYFFYSIDLLQLPATDGTKININRACDRFTAYIVNANELALRILKDITNGDRIVLALRIFIIKHICAESNIITVLAIFAHRRTSFSWFL